MSKHGLFTDEWFECPLGCGLGVTIDGDEMPCAICGRRWTIYNFPAEENDRERYENISELGSGSNEASQEVDEEME
jgi:uncharacterized Zn finger protein (UPF0148 family)